MSHARHWGLKGEGELLKEIFVSWNNGEMQFMDFRFGVTKEALPSPQIHLCIQHNPNWNAGKRFQKVNKTKQNTLTFI